MTDPLDTEPHPPARSPLATVPSEELRQRWRQGERPDVEAFLAGAGALTAAQALAVLRVDQRERWQAGEPIAAESYLKVYAPLETDPEQSLELVYAEFLLREGLGEMPTLAEYVARFPGHGDRLKIQIGLHEALHTEATLDLERATVYRDPAATMSSARIPPEAGPWPIVAGYEIVGELGRGGMGVVYQARHQALKRTVALKMILAGPHADHGQLARFRHEAEAVARLQHPNIVQIYEVGEQDGRPFLALEFAAGGTLDRALAASPQPARPAAQLLETLARATQYAHERGIIHRDLKPANVLLQIENGEAAKSAILNLQSAIPKITDFGLAKYQETNSGQTRSGTIVGTPGYMAPEQALGKTDGLSAGADIYALGAILYEMLTGRPPFKADTPLDTLQQTISQEPVRPSQLRPNVPRDLQTICLKCLEKEAVRRYATALALADDLRRYLERKPIRARPASQGERLWRWCRRNSALASLLVCVCLLVSAITVISLLSAVRLGEEADKARAAARDATEKLWKSSLVEAQALRLNRRMGQRFDSLKAIEEAVRLLPSRTFPEQDTLVLRGEAIACLALTDLRVLEQWRSQASWDSPAAFDTPLERYAQGDQRGNVVIWRTAGHQLVTRLPWAGAVPAAVTSQFSADGRFLGVRRYCNDVTIPFEVWELLAGGKIRRVLHIDTGFRFLFNPDSRSLAVQHHDGTLHLHELVGGKDRVLARNYWAHTLAFRPDGRQLACAHDRSDEVRIMDTESGEIVGRLPSPASTTALAWSGDGRLLAAAAGDTHIYVWSAAEHRCQATLKGHRQRVRTLTFQPAGRLLASSGLDGATRLWDVTSGKPLLRAAAAHICFHPDGQRLTFCSPTHVGIWEVADGRECRLLQVEDDKAESWHAYRAQESFDFSPDGRLLAAVAGDGVRLWDVAAARQLAHLRIGYQEATLFHPGDGRLFTYGRAGLLSWPLQGRDRPVIRVGPADNLKVPENTFFFQACGSRDGRVLAVANDRHEQILVLNLQRPAERVVLAGCSDVLSLAVSRDGKWVAAGLSRGDAGIKVWDARSGRLVQCLPGSGKNANHAYVAFSTDDQWLVGGGREDYRWWKVGTWEAGPVLSRENRSISIGPIAFSNDGRMIALARSPYSVQLVDALTLGELATLSAADERLISRLCFNAAGTELAASTDNHVLQIWDLRAVRGRLQALNLDWPSPPYPAAKDAGARVPLQVDVHVGP